VFLQEDKQFKRLLEIVESRRDAPSSFPEIPFDCPAELPPGSRVQVSRNHFSWVRSWSMTSSAGIVSTSPVSSWATLRSISTSQAAAIVSELSTLHQSLTARSTRSSGVNFMAALATFW